MKTILTSLTLLCLIQVSWSALSIKSVNIVGFDNTSSAVVDNTGSVLVQGSGVVAVGSFGGLSDGDVQNLNSSAAIDSAFDLIGFNTVNQLDGLWEFTVDVVGDTSAIVGKSIFTVVGNKGTISESTQFLIYRHSGVNGTGDFNQDPNTNTDAVVAVGAGATGALVVGEHGNYQHDFGAGAVDAFNLVVVPEPSSAALLGLGGVALFLRRRR